MYFFRTEFARFLWTAKKNGKKNNTQYHLSSSTPWLPRPAFGFLWSGLDGGQWSTGSPHGPVASHKTHFYWKSLSHKSTIKCIYLKSMSLEMISIVSPCNLLSILWLFFLSFFSLNIVFSIWKNNIWFISNQYSIALFWVLVLKFYANSNPTDMSYLAHWFDYLIGSWLTWTENQSVF